MCTYMMISGVCRVMDSDTISPSIADGAVILVARTAITDGGLDHSIITGLKAVGVVCIIAPGFARHLYRGMINNGIAPIECGATDHITDGDTVEVNLAEGHLTHGTTVSDFSPLPDFMRKILLAGSLAAYTEQEIANK